MVSAKGKKGLNSRIRPSYRDDISGLSSSGWHMEITYEEIPSDCELAVSPGFPISGMQFENKLTVRRLCLEGDHPPRDWRRYPLGLCIRGKKPLSPHLPGFQLTS